MGSQKAECLICRGAFGDCEQTYMSLHPSGTGITMMCQGCGTYTLTGSAVASCFETLRGELPDNKRAAISHAIQSLPNEDSGTVFVEREWLLDAIESAELPSRHQQADTLLARIGECQISAGAEGAIMDPEIEAPLAGCPSAEAFNRLISEMEHEGLVRHIGRTIDSEGRVELTIKGSRRYEKRKKKLGGASAQKGFIAMEFGHPILDRIVNDKIKPAIKDQVGYTLEDMRDSPRAGLIDNLMRARIQEAAFVLVDLSHDNAGAYWEAGYAEGLNKPVVYLCEGKRFGEKGTHFDTNHHTTVMWTEDNPEEWVDKLVAVVRETLGISETQQASES